MRRLKKIRGWFEAVAVFVFGYFGLVTFLETFWHSLHPAGRKLNRHNRERDARILKLYSEFVQPGDLCFDIGANRGNRIETFNKIPARVVAVEPQPWCVTYLRNKYRRWTNVIIVARGLAEQPGRLTMHVNWRSDLSTMSQDWIDDISSRGKTYRRERWDRDIEVPVTTLDDLISEFGTPAFCKIDVEGFEYRVLQGLSRPVPMISFEYTLEHIETAVSSVARLAQTASYEFNYSHGETMALDLPEWVTAKTIQTVLRDIAKNAAHDNVHGSGDVYARFTDPLR